MYTWKKFIPPSTKKVVPMCECYCSQVFELVLIIFILCYFFTVWLLNSFTSSWVCHCFQLLHLVLSIFEWPCPSSGLFCTRRLWKSGRLRQLSHWGNVIKVTPKTIIDFHFIVSITVPQSSMPQYSTASITVPQCSITQSSITQSSVPQCSVAQYSGNRP